MSNYKLKLLLSVCFFISTVGCGLLSLAANGSSPTPEEPTRIVDKSAGQPTAAIPTDTAEPTIQPLTTPQPIQTAASGDSSGVLKQVPDKLNALKSYRIKGQVTGGSDPGQNGPLLMEVISPDKAHLSLPSFEFYSIGTTAYYKLGANAAWMKGAQVDAGRNPLGVPVLDPRQMIESAVKAAGANLGQPGALNGKAMWVYNFTATASDPNSSTGTLWVGKDDGLPYKLLDLEQDGTNVELNYYDFDADFKIEPPIP
jgi:hypothetical protein